MKAGRILEGLLHTLRSMLCTIQHHLPSTMETMFCESVQRSMDVGTDDRAAVCEAWLGPSYQITGTLNATFAGGIQQEIHRDYRKSDIIVKADR
jgi:hypothetical protein